MIKPKHITELYIQDATLPATAFKIIKGYRKDGLLNIKNDFISHKCILSCNSVDIEALENILKCFRELIEAGLHPQLKEDGRYFDISNARNRLESMRGTQKFVNSDAGWLEED